MQDPGGICPACGSPVTRRVGGALCPACLVALALAEGEDDRDVTPGSPAHAYQVMSVLARAPGRVHYLARRQDFHAFVCLEVIAPAELARLERPAIDGRLAQLRALRHPAIARVLEGWAEPSGDWCIASDYLAGRAVTARGPAADAVGILDQVCDALSAAHARGVTHGCLDVGSVVLVAVEGGVEPRLTGFTLLEDAPTVVGDVAALGRVLAALTAGGPLAAAAASLASRAAKGEFATVTAFQAAIRNLRGG
jgi:hypothetical protein